ncbi:GlxA family transcriptional regulator [Aureimonas altamirensis]|uniref:GlxA family transcriptional regulator n=1 Tax=Aureimonas altamirensis TaxID=370622 RepID=UPI00301A8008
MVEATRPRTETVAEIGLLIYPDCQLAAVYGLTDLFRIANEWAARSESVAQKRGPAPFLRVSHWRADEAGGGIDCVYDSLAGTPHQVTHVIAPPSIVMPEKMRSMPVAAGWMNARHAEGSTLCSVCAGAFVLAETGLIDGRRVTTHWAFARQLAERFPGVELAEEQMVIDDGDIMTAGGILAWTDLGLTLVERLMGPSIMLATARFLLVDPPRRSQRPFSQFVPRFDHGDTSILRVQQHVHAHADEPSAVAELAALAGLTERTFLRRFAKATGLRPVEYLQQMRIAKARELLEVTGNTVDQIGFSVGYGDQAAFRKLFQRFTGLTPNLYRQRYGLVARRS